MARPAQQAVYREVWTHWEGGTSLSMETPARSSVDDVHANVDALMLSIFEAVRGHEAATDATAGVEAQQAVAAVKCQDIVDKYNSTLAAIDDLVGIDSTKEQQEEEIRALSAQCRLARERIMQHEDQLAAKRNAIDGQLKALLNDDVLGLQPSS